MKNMCEYPFILDGDPNRTRYDTANPDDKNPLAPGEDGNGFFPRIGTGISGQRNTNKSFTTAGNVNDSLLAGKGHKPVIRQADQLDENRIVLYKKGKQLGNGYYIVEISSNNACLFIAAYDVESPMSLLIELPEKKAQEILTEFQNDYESMSNSLSVVNNRLVLLNPVSHDKNLIPKIKPFNQRLQLRQKTSLYLLGIIIISGIEIRLAEAKDEQCSSRAQTSDLGWRFQHGHWKLETV